MKSPDTPSQPWKSIAWDFVVKLPLSREPVTGVEYDSILVITDRLTKYAYMLPFKEKCTAEDLAYTYLRIVVANHGTPDEIISDRDKLFTSKFWTTLIALLGTKHKMSTAFHPQTDGQTERLNQTMEAYLRCYVNYKQTNWVELLPLAQFAYNSAVTETTKVSPFYANYGYDPEAYQTPLQTSALAQDAMIQVDNLKSLHEELATDIRFLSQRSASYYNAGRSMGPTLKKGDKVYLLRKNVKTKRPSDKLDHKKLGPFEIEEVRGPVNYRLKLPKTMEIHPVFHVSLLEPAPLGAPPAPITEVQPINPNAVYDVEEILDCQYIRGRIRYLIKWLDYPHSENTWEPRTVLDCPEKLEVFHRLNPDLPRRGPRGQRAVSRPGKQNPTAGQIRGQK
jgi:transposase InsO family protein